MLIKLLALGAAMAATAAAGSAGHAAARAVERTRPWLDAGKPVAERVQLLLPQLTVTEKIHQLIRPDGAMGDYLEYGVGLLEFGSVLTKDSNIRTPLQLIRARNALQQKFLAAGPGKRLGLPASWRALQIHGAVAFGTVFPEGITQGRTWDKPLLCDIAAANAVTARAFGMDLYFYVLNMWSDARFGRQEEGWSEEPTLTAAYVEASLLGSHGNASLEPLAYMPAGRIAAGFKHCCAYAAAAGGQNGGRVEMGERLLREYYLKPWRRSGEHKARIVMPTHHTVNSVPCHANKAMLTDTLREEYGLRQAVYVADTGDVDKLVAFRVAADDAHAAALALNAGVDIEQGGAHQAFLAGLPAALAQNLTTMSAVDFAVSRVLAHKFSAGLFDSPYVPEDGVFAIDGTAHRALARRAAEGGIVLLVNRHTAAPAHAGPRTLPLSDAKKLRVAVIGENGGCGADGGSGAAPASASRSLCKGQLALLGNYDGHEADHPPVHGVPTVATALAKRCPSCEVSWNHGASIDSPSAAHSDPLAAAALRSAAAADVIIATFGDSSRSVGESIDRAHLTLPGQQERVLASLATLNKTLILAHVGGRAMALADEGLWGKLGAFLTTGRPGEQGATALANILFGLSPSAKLAGNWLRSSAQSGSSATPWLQQRQSGIDHSTGSVGAEGRSYASYTDVSSSLPLFSFGFGLTYSSFALSELECLPAAKSQPRLALSCSVKVCNNGTAPSATVVQLYGQDPTGVVMHVRPWKRLFAFARVPSLPPAVCSTATLDALASDVAFYSDAMEFALVKGNYTLSAGESSVSDAELVTRLALKTDEGAAGHTCSDASDCELTGDCVNGKCECHSGWTGPSCATLDLLPAPFAGAWPATRPLPPAYWGAGGTPVSWGGTIGQDDAGQWHGVFDSSCYTPGHTMHVNGFTLSHGVSSTAAGPFSYVGPALSGEHAGPTHYNPHLVALPGGKQWLLFFCGESTPHATSEDRCTGNETKPGSAAAQVERELAAGNCTTANCWSSDCALATGGSNNKTCLASGCEWDPGFASCMPPRWSQPQASQIKVAISSSPAGPWTSVTDVLIADNAFLPVSGFVDNPSPLVLTDKTAPNGYKILLAYRMPGNDTNCGLSRCSPSVIGLAEATEWSGPYTAVGDLQWPGRKSVIPYLGESGWCPSVEDLAKQLPGPYKEGCGCEDPSLFAGRNGSVHMLLHKYENDAKPGWPGLHAFSPDGSPGSWKVSRSPDKRGAYSFNVSWQTSGAQTVASTMFMRRERPQLLVDPLTLAPTYLVTGLEYNNKAPPSAGHAYSLTLVQAVNQKHPL